VDPCDRGTSASRFHCTPRLPRLCAVCATRPSRRSPAATCRRQRRLRLKARGAGGFDCFLVPVVELATSSSLVLPHRVAPEQSRASPRPALATAAGRPEPPWSLPSGPPSPSAPIASPATRGSHGAARCRTGAQQRPVYGQHAAGARLLHPEPVTHLKSVREGTNRPYGRSPSSSGDQTAVGELLPPAGTRLH
jgi:hypothetical protein